MTLASNAERIPGQRGAALFASKRSLASRMTSVVASGLVAFIGGGLLVLYYAHAASSSPAPRELRSMATKHDQGDVALPALGLIQPPARAGLVEPIALPAVSLVESSSPDRNGAASVSANSPRPTQQPTFVSPQKGTLERKLSASVFEGGSWRASMPSSTTGAAVSSVGVDTASGAATAMATSGPDIGSLLRSSEPVAARAYLVPSRRLLLPKGAFIDCTLETAIDSTLPGMTTCITATDTFGMDGSTVLLERGTKLIGETRGQVRQGSARVFVVWTEARTPTGVIVPLDSPATDELGRSGLAGDVDRHFWDRFGAAILISVIDGAVQSAVQSSSHGGGTVVYSPNGSEEIVTDVLKGTVDIPPTVRKSNGDRVQILVARDVDFRSVYELR